MTIGGIALGIIITLIILVIGACIIFGIAYDSQFIAGVTVVLSVVLIICAWIGLNWYYANTESGKRALKTQDSNFNSGIHREVIVYDMNGHELERFEGRFDVEYTDTRIMFDDENGNRHIIYFKSGTIIINELSDTEVEE